MKIIATIGLALLTGSLAAPLILVMGQETVTVQQKPLAVTPPVDPSRIPVRQEPWLGILKCSKPSQVAYAHLAKVPRGAGFVVDDVAPGGPVDLAGIGRYDVLWKLNDQLLVNEAQLMVLLDMRKVGDTVRLTYSRGGENHEVEAILGERPESEKGRDRADNIVLTPRIPGLPYQEVNVQYQTAVLREGKETVRIQRTANRYKWAVFDDFGLEMSSGELAGGSDEDFPPEVGVRLKGKLKALIRSLEAAERRRAQGPRVRRVPTSKAGKSQ